MLEEKISKVEKSVNDLKSVQEKACKLINERKVKFAMIGLNDVIRTVAEIMVLEKVLDSLNEAIETEGDDIEVMSLRAIKSEVPGAEEMLNYISLRYRDDLSDECQVLKKFIDEIQFENITNKLFEQI